MKKILMFLVAFLAMTWFSNAQILFSEGFENGTLPTGWTLIDNDGDGHNWECMLHSQFQLEPGETIAHSGEGLIASESFDAVSQLSLTPDNWVITPPIETGDNNFMLKF